MEARHDHVMKLEDSLREVDGLFVVISDLVESQV
jgi:t-SNARE complex subunit (syntaxin)